MKQNFPGDPGVKTALAMQGVWVQSPVGELRAHMRVVQKKKNLKKEKNEAPLHITACITDKPQKHLLSARSQSPALRSHLFEISRWQIYRVIN